MVWGRDTVCFLLCFVISVMLITVFPEPPRCKKAIWACRAGTSTILWLMEGHNGDLSCREDGERKFMHLHGIIHATAHRVVGFTLCPLFFSQSQAMFWNGVKVTFFSVLELGGHWSTDAVAAVHIQDLLLRSGKLWPICCLAMMSWGAIRSQNTLPLRFKFSTMTAAGKVEMSFLITSHMSSSSEDIFLEKASRVDWLLSWCHLPQLYNISPPPALDGKHTGSK